MRIVHTYYGLPSLEECKKQALLFCISLNVMGHSTEIVDLVVGNGCRVWSDDKGVDFVTNEAG